MAEAVLAVWSNRLEKKAQFLANQDISFHPKQDMFYKNEHIFFFAKYTAGL